jgi:hypothetical protein
MGGYSKDEKAALDLITELVIQNVNHRAISGEYWRGSVNGLIAFALTHSAGCFPSEVVGQLTSEADGEPAAPGLLVHGYAFRMVAQGEGIDIFQGICATPCSEDSEHRYTFVGDSGAVIWMKSGREADIPGTERGFQLGGWVPA